VRCLQMSVMMKKGRGGVRFATSSVYYPADPTLITDKVLTCPHSRRHKDHIMDDFYESAVFIVCTNTENWYKRFN
jgi:hypothetical protein